mgnify:CR=1 FL=1
MLGLLGWVCGAVLMWREVQARCRAEQRSVRERKRRRSDRSGSLCRERASESRRSLELRRDQVKEQLQASYAVARPLSCPQLLSRRIKYSCARGSRAFSSSHESRRSRCKAVRSRTRHARDEQRGARKKRERAKRTSGAGTAARANLRRPSRSRHCCRPETPMHCTRLALQLGLAAPGLRRPDFALDKREHVLRDAPALLVPGARKPIRMDERHLTLRRRTAACSRARRPERERRARLGRAHERQHELVDLNARAARARRAQADVVPQDVDAVEGAVGRDGRVEREALGEDALRGRRRGREVPVLDLREGRAGARSARE